MRLNESVPQISLSELLRKLSELGGSDLHITTGSPPQVRVDGHLRPLESYRVLTSADTKQLAYSVLTDAQKHRFEENLELDFSFGVKGLSRFRAQAAEFPGRAQKKQSMNACCDHSIDQRCISLVVEPARLR